MRTKSTILLGLALVLLLPLIRAEPVSVEIAESSGDVEVGDDATFKVIITNNQEERDVFKIAGDEFAIYPFSEFASLIKADPSQVKLNPEESAEVTITIKTLDTAKINTKYLTKIKVASLINPEEKTTFEVETFLASAKNVVEISTNLPEELKPGQEITIPIKFKNRAYIPLKNIDIYTSSDVANIAERIIINFKEREEITKNVKIKFDEITKPGIHTINIKAYKGGDLRGSFTKDIIILPRENLKDEQEAEKGFLATVTTITVANRGNIISEQKTETHYSLFKRIFTSAEPKPEVERGNYVWTFTLEPGEETTAVITTNYRPLLYGIIIIILFTIGMLYHIERSVVLKKRIFRIKEESHGISEFKIILHLRNGKKYTLKEVKVLDILPHIIKATNDFGTLKPTKIQKGERSVRMIWEIGDLDPREERVLSYKVKSKMNLLGEVKLPAASAHFSNKNDKLEEIKSLRLKVIKKER